MGKGRTYRSRKRRVAGEQQAQAKGLVSRDKEWIELRCWCKRRRMPKSKLTLAYFPGTLRGMMATKDICKGDDIVRVPEHLLVTASKAARDIAAASNPVKADPFSLSEHQTLVYWLYTEHKRGKSSNWLCYLNSLPRDFPSVPLFVLSGESPRSELSASSAEAQWILKHIPYSVHHKVAEQQSRLFVDWSRTRLYVSAVGTRNVDDWRCYVWAWLAVNTRCIHLGQNVGSRDTIALAPFLDLLNHGKDARVTTYFDLASRQFVIKTLTPYKRGREVLISYGPHDNPFMLAEYGFVLADNPFQTLEMDQHVHEWAAAVKSKLRPGTPGRPATMQPGDIDELICALKQHGLWGDFTLSPDNGDISYRLHAALQLLLQDVSSKRAIAWWERWRRGEPSHNNDLDNRRHAIRSWVTATCQTIADAATRNMDAIHRFRYAQETSQRYLVNDFLARCLHMLWEEEHAIAKSFLVP